MKDDLLKSFTAGFTDSFRLAGYLVLAVVAVISAFANHSFASDKDSPGSERASSRT